MISLPNPTFSEFTESVNSDEELNETNYCDQKTITMEFSFEAHDLLNDMICHALDTYDFVNYLGIHDLPEDSPVRRRYEMLESMKECSFKLWNDRFGNAPYKN